MEKAEKNHKLSEFGIVDYVIWGILALICFFCFQQGDILHTAGSSLSFLNGHIWDFYDENLKYLSADAYLPSTYIIFAIWNIPIRLLGIVKTPSMTVPTVALMWYKLCPVIFYLLSGVIFYKICVTMGMDKKNAKIAAYIFISCPMGFFSQFIFGQYDIFTVFFMLLGYYFYLKNNNKMFVVFFSIAITFKYFALLFFIPLLLLKQKNIFKIIINVLCVVIPTFMEIAFYIHSSGFKEGVFGFGATNYIFAANIDTGFDKISIVVVLWIVVCVYAYLTLTSQICEYSVFCLNVVAYICFGLSMWHPQWLLLIVPFLSLGIVLNKHSDVLLFLELVLMCIACVYIVNRWPNHVDQNLFNLGVLNGITKEPLGSKLNMSTLYVIKNNDLVMSLFSGCLCALTIFKYPKYTVLDKTKINLNKNIWYIRSRFLVGILFFVVPAFICLYSTTKAPFMYYSSFNNISGAIGNDANTVTIEQEMVSEYDYLSMLELCIGKFDITCNGKMKISILANGKTLEKYTCDLKDIKSENAEKIDIKDVYIGKGKEYVVKIKMIPDAGSAGVPIYYGNTSEPYSVVNGEQQSYNICLKAFGRD